MSSILDALKKSDAERQRGLPPTLNSPAAFHRTRPPQAQRTRWWLPAAAVAGVALAWWMGVFDVGGDDAPADALVVERTEETSAGTTGAAPAITSAAPPSQDVPPAAAAAIEPTPAPPSEAPVNDPSAAAPDQRPRRVGFGPFPATPNANPENRADDATAAAVPASPDSAAAPASSAAAPGPAAASVTDEQDAKAVAATPTPPPAAAEMPAIEPLATPSPAPTPARADGIPTLYELPFAARRSLPEIAVTMHMYSADPTRRFALINGTRVRDGESIEGGIEVVHILADGVQLRIEGTEFVLPVSN